MSKISRLSSAHRRKKKVETTANASGDVILFELNARGAGAIGRPHVVEPDPVPPKDGTLDDAILKAEALPEDALLLALDLGVKLADCAAAEEDEALFYQRIMGMYAVTARILRDGDRL